jgi:hypothetical protein
MHEHFVHAPRPSVNITIHDITAFERKIILFFSHKKSLRRGGLYIAIFLPRRHLSRVRTKVIREIIVFRLFIGYIQDSIEFSIMQTLRRIRDCGESRLFSAAAICSPACKYCFATPVFRFHLLSLPKLHQSPFVRLLSFHLQRFAGG